MKYLHICFRLSKGGILSFINYIITLNSIYASKHDVLIMDDRKTFCSQIFSDAKIYAFKMKIGSSLKLIRKILSILKEYDAFLLHSVHPIIIILIMLKRKKTLVFQHGLTFNSKNLLVRTIKTIWHSVVPILLNAKIICSTSSAKKKLRERSIFIPNSIIKIIPFGIILPSGRSSNCSYSNLRDKIRVGVAANFLEQKRISLVLESFKDYRGQISYMVYIAGEGPESKKLKRLAAEIKSDKVKVYFLGWVSNMDSFYSNIDVFVLPSRAESFGFVIAESLSRGVPVAVFSDVGGAVCLLTHMYNGFILNNVNELKELWHKLEQDQEILIRLRENIMNMNISNLDIKNTRREIERLLFREN